jgi:hypothetical protein
MSSDISRQRFDPTNDFSAVLMQQGRVLLDADWNEWMEIINRRLRAETTDIIGRAVVPKETINGFKIGLTTGGMITIGPGRMYVHGLLAENHGKQMKFDPVLAELYGVAPLPYNEQRPYSSAVPGPYSPPPSQGRHLVYLDVWQREVTCLEDPGLVESAVGVDSTSRMQTVWRVEVLSNVGAETDCSTPDEKLKGWLDHTRPSGGRLSTGTVAVPPDQDPCLIPPSGGYRALENRLYRVEIHQRGEPGTATFKWARHNASIASRVAKINGRDIVVESLGRDNDLRFSEGNWVEITDDVREFAGVAGEIRKVTGVAPDTLTITLDQGLPADFPVDGFNNTPKERHTRIRRWDQHGTVKDTNGNILADLDAGNPGVITVPANGASVVLEDGIQITFSTASGGGEFRVGDYWVFAARTEDASVEVLHQAPPRGVHHHYCRLAVITLPGTVRDCRLFWPPDFGSGTDGKDGTGCSECSVCVTAESHNSGSFTIQMAVDQVGRDGATICLGPGIYNVSEPIRVIGVASLKLRGQGWMTILAHPGAGPVLEIGYALGFTMENLTVLSSLGGGIASDVTLVNSAAVTVRHCCFIQAAGGEKDAAAGVLSKSAIGLGGFLIHVRLQENMFFTRAGVANLLSSASDKKYAEEFTVQGKVMPLITVGFICQDNAFICALAGIRLRQFSVHLEETRIAGNDFYMTRFGAVILTGVVPGGILSGSNVDITDNSLSTEGAGVVVGVSNARINGNDICGETSKQNGDGITLTDGFIPMPVHHSQIIGNRIQRLQGDGITLLTRIASAMIKQNVVDNVTGGGITMGDEAVALHLSIEANHLLNLGLAVSAGSNQPGPAMAVMKLAATRSSTAGISLVHVRNADIAHNVLDNLGAHAAPEARLAGIQVSGSQRLRIGANRINNLGPSSGQLRSADAILVLGPFGQVDVTDNSIRRNDLVPLEGRDDSSWWALRIMETPGSALSGGMVYFNTGGFSAYLGKENVVITALTQGAASVRGNTMDYYGRSAAVRIAMDGRCAFNDNRATSLLPTEEPVVLLVARAIILNANYLLGPVNADGAGDPKYGENIGGKVGGNGLVVAKLSVDKGSFTVVGNITSAPIVVDGSLLPDPWNPLNVISP